MGQRIFGGYNTNEGQATRIFERIKITNLKNTAMETKKSALATAIIQVMKAVEGIDKSMTVGTGSSSYKGVPDQQVKKIIGEAMAKNGLCILPIETTPRTEISRWEETYSGQKKQKQSVFTEVTTKYLLLHESGESQVIAGYGHGVDSQDKGAGKASTYALKYALLYLFLVPTGTIDDADKTHSDSIETPVKKDADNRPWITQKLVDQVLQRMKVGDADVYQKTIATYRIKKEFKEQLDKLLS